MISDSGNDGRPEGKEQAVKDPILDLLTSTAEPNRDDILKQDTSTEAAATGGPPAGRTTIDEARRRGPLGLLQLLGPGLVTGASDDDPSGIGTYSQVGSQFGFGLLWTALFTFPLMAAVQELCARISLATGLGLGTNLRRKFPTPLVGVCIMGLLVANTFNIGADLGAVAAGGSLLTRGHIPAPWLLVPVALLISVLQVVATYRVIFSIFKWLTLALFSYVVSALLVRPSGVEVLAATFVPHIELSRDFIQALVAVFGTTISPYLFFWQASSEVDEMKAARIQDQVKRRGSRRPDVSAARLDILVGMLFSQVIMYAIIVTAAAAFHAHGKSDVSTAEQAARALEPVAGPFAFVVFAVGLIGTGLLAIPILSGSAAYAVKEFMGWSGGLATKARYRPTFYILLLAATLAGLGMNYIGLDPIRALFITAIINGVVAPPLLVLIVLFGSDRARMLGQVSGRLSRVLTWAATGIMAIAAIAMVVTMVRH